MTTQEQILKDILVELRAIRAQTEKGKHGYNWTPDGLPICPRHNEVMPRREKQGDEWYSHKVVDEHGEVHYCRGYASKGSPGWSVLDPIPNNDGTPADPPPPNTPTIQPLDIQRTAPASTANNNDIIAQPIETDHGKFYKAASAALEAGKIQFDKFNALVNRASREGYAAALEELQGIV